MTRDEAINEIVEELEELVLRTQGIGDYLGEIDLRELAESVFNTAQRAES